MEACDNTESITYMACDHFGYNDGYSHSINYLCEAERNASSKHFNDTVDTSIYLQTTQ